MDKLISTLRLRESTSGNDRTSKQQFESDRGRVIFSPAFRRMQSKAQVFSLESNAAVRSRLTHSLEVAHIGKYIAQKILQKVTREGNQQLIDFAENIEPIIETACFLHDIGNPPFGHLGEEAIKEWFKENSESLYKKSTGKKIRENSSRYLDIANFDGNPQGLRIALILQGEASKKGLNLTYSQIASLIKYPTTSSEKNKNYKKFGVFTSEIDDVKKIWKTLELEWGQRHPFVYIMEASDDIAYCLSDIEDGIEKKIISNKEVLEYLKGEFSSLKNKSIKNCIPESKEQDDIIAPYISFRINMINLYVEEAADIFIKSIKNKHFKPTFFENKTDDSDDYSRALAIIKKYCREKLYKSPEAEDIEIAGYNIVHGLLEKFSTLMTLNKDEFKSLVDGNAKGLHLQNRMFGKLPKKLLQHYNNETKLKTENQSEQELELEWFCRLQLIIDYISGMTDDFSLQFHSLLNGIEIKKL